MLPAILTYLSLALAFANESLLKGAKEIACTIPSPLNVVVPVGCSSDVKLDVTTKAHNGGQASPLLSPLATITPTMHRLIGDDPFSLKIALFKRHINDLMARVPREASVQSSELGALDALLDSFDAAVAQYSDAVLASSLVNDITTFEYVLEWGMCEV